MKVTSENYIDLCVGTESPISDALVERISNPENIRLLHGSIGACTEAGEMIDALKKHIYYGKPLDKVNLLEECGDLLWYCSIIMDALGASYQEVMQTNIEKLAARYPDKFSEESAINRNLDVERSILEK